MPVAAMQDRVLALAGLLQSVRLVQQMANNGQAETRALAPCIDSLFRFDADSTEAVYGGRGALESGLRRVVAQLDGSDRDGAQTRMAMNVLHLERRFVGKPRRWRRCRSNWRRCSGNASPGSRRTRKCCRAWAGSTPNWSARSARG
jgi:CII-binding regulator of phage lambda lysogenization HflD